MGAGIDRNILTRRPIYPDMKEAIEKNADRRDAPESEKILGGFIASALDMEDRLTTGTYADYMNRDCWPAAMPEESFETIKAYLTVLIKDTEKHIRMLLFLREGLNSDARE